LGIEKTKRAWGWNPTLSVICSESLLPDRRDDSTPRYIGGVKIKIAIKVKRAGRILVHHLDSTLPTIGDFVKYD
jgi:hypothetical protein